MGRRAAACLLLAGVLCGAAELDWTDARQLGIRGRGFPESVLGSWADRLPAAAQGKIRDEVWQLSRDSAGLYVDFSSNASSLTLNITYVYNSFTMYHFPSTGFAGMDLYGWDSQNGVWRWVATTRENTKMVEVNKVPAFPDRTQKDGHRRYRLNLPIYNGAAALSIGHPPGTLRAVAAPPEQAPVVWYGTSIAQGGVVSRPGMAFTNQISRNIGREVLNFGFSGNCLMEPAVAQFLVNVTPAPAAFVVDCSWNMQAALIAQRAAPLLTMIRSALGPDVPIIVAEDTTSGSHWLEAPGSGQQLKWDALHSAFTNLSTADRNLHYVTHDQLYNFSYDRKQIISPTVAGCHPSDLGQKAIADFYSGFLPGLLKAGTSARPAAAAAAPAVSGRVASAAEDAEHRRTVAEGMRAEGSALHNAAPAGAAAGTVWYDVEKELGVVGRAFNGTKSYFNRLPAAAEGVVRDTVWALSQMSTGMAVPFVTDSKAIAVNYTLASPVTPLWHMPQTGMHGGDLFRFDESVGEYRFVHCVTSFSYPAPIVQTLYSDLPAGEGRYLFFLPLRNNPVRMAMGVLSGSSMKRDPSYSRDGVTVDGKKPVVWYGTSIDQGGVASRPGSTYTNILTRKLGRAVLNFGFAGNGKMETSVAQFLTQIDAALIVIDCLPNLGPSDVTSRTVPLVNYLRANGHKDTPIVLAAGTTYGDHWVSPSANDNKRAALKAQYDKLVAAGDKHLHLLLDANDEFFASDPLVNPTVGGTHPSDLGHREIANFYADYLPKLLA